MKTEPDICLIALKKIRFVSSGEHALLRGLHD